MQQQHVVAVLHSHLKLIITPSFPKTSGEACESLNHRTYRYLPIQKLENILSNKSSLVNVPVISPKVC